jgi:hypothetical protein
MLFPAYAAEPANMTTKANARPNTFLLPITYPFPVLRYDAEHKDA